MKPQWHVLCLAIVVSGSLLAPLAAANRFFIESRTLRPGSTGNVLSVLGDFDQDTYALSVHLRFDGAKLNVTDVSLGADLVALAPEFADGVFSNNPGAVAYGVLLDLTDPITKRVLAGERREVLRLTVDVTATTDTSVELDLVNELGPPSRLNVMADENGDPVSPSPLLADGTITVASLAPVIQSFVNNSGAPDAQFFVFGRNFDQPNLRVIVGGREAPAIAIDAESLSVVAPACPPGGVLGFAAVEVCTDEGCASEANGFNYTRCGPVPPLIDLILNNRGVAGSTFFVSGRGFDAPALRVILCGREAEFVLLGPDLRVTAPPCSAAGWSEIQVCNDAGCDAEAEGFFYEPTGTPFRRGDINNDNRVDLSDPVAFLNELFSGVPGAAPCADARDANDDGRIDVSDAIFALAFLFGGGSDIPPPFDAPGLDPTPDDLPEC